MHICVISTYFPTHCGIASYTHYLTGALKSSDDSLKLTLLTARSGQEKYSLPFDIFPAFDRDEDYPPQLTILIKKLNPDIVHIQHEYGIFGYDDRFLILLEQLRLSGIRTVVTMHTVHTKLSFVTGCTYWQERRLLKKVDIERYQRMVGQLADTIIVHQERTIRQVLLRQGIPGKKVITVPHGTRIERPIGQNAAKLALNIATNERLVMAFGYLEPSKNLLLLIKAFERVRSQIPGTRLWLCGYVRFANPESIAYKKRCKKFIENHGLTDAITFTDAAIPEDKVPEVLSAADVVSFVYNEDTHSSSGALHIALGLGKAVMASRIPKFEELSDVSDELLVNPQSVRELTALLKRLIVDGDFRKYAEAKAKTFAEKTSWAVTAKKHCLIYNKLVPLKNPGIRYLKTVNQ